MATIIDFDQATSKAAIAFAAMQSTHAALLLAQEADAAAKRDADAALEQVQALVSTLDDAGKATLAARAAAI